MLLRSASTRIDSRVRWQKWMMALTVRVIE